MRVIKPQPIALLTRCYEHRRRSFLGVSMMAFVPAGSEVSLLHEVALWKFVSEKLGKDSGLDSGIEKTHAEYLITGKAFAPEGRPKPSLVVRVHLGTHEKALCVFGDRHWRALDPTEPKPFRQMPLDWEHAFGGEGFAQNPLGKGFAPVLVGGRKVHPLPNVEDPSRLLTVRSKRPEPAGFGPIDQMWPQRYAKAGTYDDRWLKEDFPGFAADTDWRFFNLAPADQQFEAPFQGEEPYLLENMHPTKPRLEGRLPGIAMRCYANRRLGEAERFEEVPSRLTTIWFFPAEERIVLIFQGSVPTDEDDASDVLQLVVGAERMGEPKSEDHYRAVLANRLDEEKGAMGPLKDHELLPQGIGATNPVLDAEAALFDSKGLLHEKARRRAQRQQEEVRGTLASLGLDPAVFAFSAASQEEPPTDPEGFAAYCEKAIQDAEKQKAEAEARLVEQDAALAQLFSQAGLDFGALKAELNAKPKALPILGADDQLQALRDLAAECRARGAPLADLEDRIADPVFLHGLSQGAEQSREGYRLTAHLQDPAKPRPAEEAARVRNESEASHAQGGSFAGRDLTGADLSGLDLRGADFEGAFLESCNLAAANLEGANLERAVLAHSSLRDARLAGARLRGANLGGADMRGVRAEGADLEQAILARADLTAASLRRARLQGADLSSAVFKDTDLSEVEAAQVTFLESDLRGLVLSGARMEKSIFLKTDISGVDFSGARLAAAMFLHVNGKGARFRGADMQGVRFVQQCALDGADFTSARLASANLRGSSAQGCDFTAADLDDADLSECDLRSARFGRATARNARFVKADLAECVLASLNAMNASFERSNARGADFRGANLFGADFARIRTDERTNLSDALMTKVRLYPKATT